jgi:hypothetical protein
MRGLRHDVLRQRATIKQRSTQHTRNTRAQTRQSRSLSHSLTRIQHVSPLCEHTLARRHRVQFLSFTRPLRLPTPPHHRIPAIRIMPHILDTVARNDDTVTIVATPHLEQLARETVLSRESTAAAANTHHDKSLHRNAAASKSECHALFTSHSPCRECDDCR